MRFSLILSAAVAGALAVPSLASAATPVSEVSIRVTPQVQKKIDRKYGQRELTYLSADLRRSIEKEAGVSPSGDRLEVTITDIKPNRPTFKQLGDRVGLTMDSVSIGGATLEGVRVAPDGRRTPVNFQRYDVDIIQAAQFGLTTWSTAQNTFDGFARKVAKQ